MNIVLITSVIKTPDKALSYTKTRSVFTYIQRFEQTQKTIESIRENIPDSKIVMVECSDLPAEMTDDLMNNTDVYLNVFDNTELKEKIYSKSKSMCESTQVIYGLEYITKNMEYTNIFKISGRYWLSDTFDYNLFNNDLAVIKPINNNKNNVFTALYKFPSKHIDQYLMYMKNATEQYKKCIGLEIIFAKFIHTISQNEKKFLLTVGLEGFVSVCGSKYVG